MRKQSCGLLRVLPSIYSLITAVGLCVVRSVAMRNEEDHHLTGSNNGFCVYISIAGTVPVADTIFSQVMNLSAFLAFFVSYLRFLQLKEQKVCVHLNRISFAVFSLSCIGMTIVANFQVTTAGTFHRLGLLIASLMSIIYCWMQTFVSNQGKKNLDQMINLTVRFMTSGVNTVLMIGHMLREPELLGLNAPCSQWWMVFNVLIFISSFSVDFGNYDFNFRCTEWHPEANKPQVKSHRILV